jgi:hypothetical protein
MITLCGVTDNYSIVPSPVLDLTQPKKVRIEQRLQVTLKAAANEQPYTIEFRPTGDDHDQTPTQDQLSRWIDEGELVQVNCTSLAARPFVHQEGKTYRSRGKEVQIGDEKAALDSFVIFAGVSMAPLTGNQLLEEAVKQARGAFKRAQRAYRAKRNEERAQQLEAQREERVQKLLERQAAAEAAQATSTAGTETAVEADGATVGTNGRKR